MVTPTLHQRLRDILVDSDDCLVGIPNLHSPTPKAAYWWRQERSAELLSHRTYASAFITRPDSAPWIDTPAYWRQLESLWLGRDVTLVRGSRRSLVAEDLVGAEHVLEIVTEPVHAWTSYASLLLACEGARRRTLLCLGPTATVLAVDLCARGIHAIDLGHIGMFLKKHRCGTPMTRTEADKVVA
jgi:hypothetical protein